MKKILGMVGMFLAFVSMSRAQGSEISFETKQHDFGEVEEVNGPVSYYFNFENTGQTPLVVNGVTTSCGCTASEWTKEPIKPQGEGHVKVTYNVVGRPGPFRKTITVKSNASEATTMLTITGTVIPRPKTVEEEYPEKIKNGIRLKSKSTPLVNVYKGDSKVERIAYKNVSGKDVKLAFLNVPKHIAVASAPETVKAGESGEIVITYNTKGLSDYGERVDEFYVTYGGDKEKNAENAIKVKANVKEDFRNLTAEQKANAPRVEIDPTLVKENMKKGEKRTVVVTLKNTGKSALIIHKMEKDTGIEKATSNKKTIAAGEEAKLTLYLSTENLTYSTYSKLTVITNAPNNPVLILPVNLLIE